jgi:hypothetical protein
LGKFTDSIYTIFDLLEEPPYCLVDRWAGTSVEGRNTRTGIVWRGAQHHVVVLDSITLRVTRMHQQTEIAGTWPSDSAYGYGFMAIYFTRLEVSDATTTALGSLDR